MGIAVLLLAGAALARTAGPPPESEVQRRCRSVNGAVLLDAETRQPLFLHRPRAAHPPASVVKLMLLLLAAEAFESGRRDPDDKVAVSRRADDTGGQQLYLAEGETHRLGELALWAAVHSANDAAVALAEGLFGTYERAVEMMNARARELRMTEARFRTPHGLPASWGQQGDRASATDLAILGCEAVRHRLVREWCSTRRTSVPGRDLVIVNSNEMLGKIEGVDGLKTGFTQRAGWCLVATAEREGRRLVCAILGAPSSRERFDLARVLFDYGFGRFERLPILEAGEIVDVRPVEGADGTGMLPLSAANALSLWLDFERPVEPVYRVVVGEPLRAPIAKGERVGEVLVFLEGRPVGRVGVLAAEAAPEPGGMRRWLERVAGRVSGRGATGRM